MTGNLQVSIFSCKIKIQAYIYNRQVGIYDNLVPGWLQVLIFSPKIWSQACTSNQRVAKNMKCDMYLALIPIYLIKIWGVEAWLMVNTCFFIKNICWNVYLWLGRLHLPVFAFPLIKILQKQLYQHIIY